MPRKTTSVIPIWQKSKLGKIFGLTITDLNTHSSNFCNLTSHYLYTKLIDLGAEELPPILMTADSISEASQFYFNMKNFTVTLKHVKPPKEYKGSCGIECLENISHPFKIVNIMDLTKIT